MNGGEPNARPPNVPLFRALWSPLDGNWGLLKRSWGLLEQSISLENVVETLDLQ